MEVGPGAGGGPGGFDSDQDGELKGSPVKPPLPQRPDPMAVAHSKHTLQPAAVPSAPITKTPK